MLVSADGGTVGEEEVGAGLARNGGLDPGDGLGHGSELESAHAGGGQERGEDHVVARRHADDVVYGGVEALHDSAARPAGPQNHHPRLLAGRRGAEARRPRAEMGKGEAKRRSGGGGISGSEWR